MGLKMEETVREEAHGEERGGEVDETLARTLARRRRHRERSMFVRAGVVVAGSGIGIFAGLLSVIAPELGLPLMLVGLRLLALEFDWAARLYTRVAKLAKKAAGLLGKLWPKSKLGISLTVVALVGALVAVFVLFG